MELAIVAMFLGFLYALMHKLELYASAHNACNAEVILYIDPPPMIGFPPPFARQEAPMIAKDDRGLFLADWWTELMRGDAWEDGAAREWINKNWPRAYVLTPPTYKRVASQRNCKSRWDNVMIEGEAGI